ncbi:MAG: ATP-binding cassette domain-containing protein [Pseudomonadota bacterium]
MLKLNNISLNLGQQQILFDINLDVNKNEIIIMLGSNGSGKSSLLKLIDRRYSMQKGSLTIDGISIEKYSQKNLAKTIITLTQNPLDSLFPKLTVKENCLLACYRAEKNPAAFEDHLAQFNPKLVSHLNTLSGHLSGGEQQALVLALACLAKPKILLLDEHTSALDPHTAENLMQLTQEKIKAHGITCIISTHQLEHALQYGDRLIALQEGRILKNYSKIEKVNLSLERIRKECYQH